jgi:hypothetical protein
MSRKTRDKVFICGGEEAAGATNVSLQRFDCPNERRHAPMPEAYGAWHAVAEKRVKAGQDSRLCSGCGRYALAVGGRSVRGWPRQMRRLAA